MTQSPERSSIHTIGQLEVALERIANSQSGRGTSAARPWALGSAGRAAARLASPAARIAFVTGFFLPHADPPAAETDGPVGTAVLATILSQAGRDTCVVTDIWSHKVVGATLASCGYDGEVLVAHRSDDVERCRSRLADMGITDLLLVERPGSSTDGRRYSMSGIDISDCNLPFELLVEDARWTTIAIGDGGNELGLGAIPRHLLEGRVPNAARILAQAQADIAILASVSNWGCYAVAMLLAAGRPEFIPIVESVLSPDNEAAIIDAAVAAGAVDGVHLRPNRSVDRFDTAVSGAVILEMKAALAEVVSRRP